MAASVALTVASVRKPQRCVVVRGDEDAPHEHRVTPNGAPPRAARQVSANEASVGASKPTSSPARSACRRQNSALSFPREGARRSAFLALPRVAHPLPPHAHTGGDEEKGSGYCVLAAGAPATPVRELALLTACAPTTTKPPTAPLFSPLRAATYVRDAGPATDRAALERAAARGLAMMCCDVCIRGSKKMTLGARSKLKRPCFATARGCGAPLARARTCLQVATAQRQEEEDQPHPWDAHGRRGKGRRARKRTASEEPSRDCLHFDLR